MSRPDYVSSVFCTPEFVFLDFDPPEKNPRAQPIFSHGFVTPNQPELLSGLYLWNDHYGNQGWRHNRAAFDEDQRIRRAAKHEAQLREQRQSTV